MFLKFIIIYVCKIVVQNIYSVQEWDLEKASLLPFAANSLEKLYIIITLWTLADRLFYVCIVYAYAYYLDTRAKIIYINVSIYYYWV